MKSPASNGKCIVQRFKNFHLFLEIDPPWNWSNLRAIRHMTYEETVTFVPPFHELTEYLDVILVKKHSLKNGVNKYKDGTYIFQTFHRAWEDRSLVQFPFLSKLMYGTTPSYNLSTPQNSRPKQCLDKEGSNTNVNRIVTRLNWFLGRTRQRTHGMICWVHEWIVSLNIDIPKFRRSLDP